MWQSRRSMQRQIAEELKLDKSVMAIFDEFNEDDDFNGVEKSSRAEIADVADHISRVLRDHRLLVLFHNGSDVEIDLSRFGIPLWAENKVLWTFHGKFRLKPFQDNVKISDAFRGAWPKYGGLSDRDVTTLVHTEATELAHCISRCDITPTIATDCWFYMALLHYSHGNIKDYDQDAHASSYWVCDGIIEGESAWEASSRLREAMRLEHLPTKQNKTIWFDQFSNNQGNKSRWISITSEDVKTQNIQTIPQEATSYFLTFLEPMTLPKDLFPQSSELRVLKLSCCTFSFASPPFLCCRNLRFLWIDSCKDIELTDGLDEKHEKWTCLQSLLVLDIRCTDWPWILSPQMMELMIELQELNVKAARANRWTWCMTTPKLKLLHNLLRFRVIDSSTYLKVMTHELLVEMEKLELLDLSDSGAMKLLPNLSGASRLKVLILDGCAGLENVEPHLLPTSLESFSFDGFGPASGWKHSLEMPEKKARPSASTNQELPRVSKISLDGCAHLKSVFFRGLPNLKELNLSNTAIEELDLNAMQIQQLERLILLGCENLRRVQWHDGRNPRVKLLRIDTRAKTTRAMDDDCQGSCSYYQVPQGTHHRLAHVVVADARFFRGFRINVGDTIDNVFGKANMKFHLHLSHNINHTHVKGTNKQKEISPMEEFSVAQAVGLSFPYADVLGKVVNKDGEDVFSVQACMQLVPLERHIEITEGGCNWERRLQDRQNMDSLMNTTESLHVHNHSSITIGNVGAGTLTHQFINMRWCRVERCPKLHAVFLLDEFPIEVTSYKSLENLRVSQLPHVQCIWSRNLRFYEDEIAPVRAFKKLRYIHLHSCHSLKFVLPWSLPALPSMETIHITDCGELTQIFPKGEPYKGKSANRIEFPCLKQICLHDLPKLQHICEIQMLAPALETIKFRGCWNLRWLPAIDSGRSGDKQPTVVDCEEDCWDKLVWDGMEASRCLFRPQHSRYYRKTIPRGSLLR